MRERGRKIQCDLNCKTKQGNLSRKNKKTTTNSIDTEKVLASSLSPLQKDSASMEIHTQYQCSCLLVLTYSAVNLAMVMLFCLSIFLVQNRRSFLKSLKDLLIYTFLQNIYKSKLLFCIF